MVAREGRGAIKEILEEVPSENVEVKVSSGTLIVDGVIHNVPWKFTIDTGAILCSSLV